MSLDVSADQERLIFGYEVPPTLTNRTDLLLSRTPFAMMSVVLCPAAEAGEVHVHTASDMFWFVVTGTVSFFDEQGELIGELGPEQGIVIPRGYAFRHEITPDLEKGLFEAYRFGASDSGSEEFVDDRVWLTGPSAVAEGISALESIEKSPHKPATFTYERPVLTGGKAMDILSITDRGIFAFQVLRAGGETNMHSHTHLDGFWFVRRGKARFYTGGAAGNVVLGELGANQGVLIPRDYPYWFEAVLESEDDECEILQMEVSDRRLSGQLEDLVADRTDYTPPNSAQLQSRIEQTGSGMRAVIGPR
jgi:mannose-6-phosphate isomerase-like protein (cupin superfamily)